LYPFNQDHYNHKRTTRTNKKKREKYNVSEKGASSWILPSYWRADGEEVFVRSTREPGGKKG